ncbi:MAG TPA: ABC transporter permease [Candidatus Acidoferrales bacterium]|nr:ABC transporter permease [Candidatus Acidoferrales bacterium]
MRSFYAVYRKEMGHYFVSPVAYVVIGVFVFVTGFFFTSYIGQAILAGLQGMQMGMTQQDLPGEVMRAFFGIISLLILFFLPMLTMGVYAEERKRGTMELLMTSPITETQIVLGKFFASLSLYAIMLVPTAGYLTYMYFHSDPIPPWRMMLAGYVGVLLFGGALLALGTFLSSLTENQIIAAILTFTAFLMLWVLNLGANASSSVGAVLGYLSVIAHYNDFTKGVVDTSSLIYYLSFIFLFLFLTVRAVDSLRWRRA